MLAMFVAGIMMVIAGIAEVINAFRSETCGKFFALPPLDAVTSSPDFFARERRLRIRRQS
jgi:hypothetical protein